MQQQALPLTGRRALITGGTRGIGLAIARAFIDAGADVWINGRDASGAQQAFALGAHFIAADLAEPAEATRLADVLGSAIDRLDVLVNNAGIEVAAPVESVSAEVLDHTWAVNARAPVLLMQRLLPLLKASGKASVINITSIHSSVPYAGNIAYCMAKAAQEMAARVAALELAAFGIRVNNLAPGAIETDINRHVLDRMGRENFARWIPAGRVGAVEEMAGPALFLASDASSYVTGATLAADGAYSQNLLRYRADAAH